LTDPELDSAARPDRKTIQTFFNGISKKYDFLNSFLSLGLDQEWRNELVKAALTGSERSILDLGAGTGKSLAAFLSAHYFERAVGCDFSESMLQASSVRLKDRADLIRCDFHKLPFASGAFDLVTGSFILRSAASSLGLFFIELKRVLKQKGKIAFLELTRPANWFFRSILFEPYLKYYLPTVGRIVSSEPDAYQFLSQSIQSFPEPSDLKKEFEAAGFANITVHRLHSGIATIIQGASI
jgi:demethylmenaquinone methyltransferase/2-methoxy-6-polyprenyl-1,4-benzoquinol methylase